jgi:hypothetical protein
VILAYCRTLNQVPFARRAVSRVVRAILRVPFHTRRMGASRICHASSRIILVCRARCFACVVHAIFACRAQCSVSFACIARCPRTLVNRFTIIVHAY